MQTNTRNRVHIDSDGIVCILSAGQQTRRRPNPEPRHLWGSGDSAVPRYEPVITMHECQSAKQLAAVIDQLLPA